MHCNQELELTVTLASAAHVTGTQDLYFRYYVQYTVFAPVHHPTQHMRSAGTPSKVLLTFDCGSVAFPIVPDQKLVSHIVHHWLQAAVACKGVLHICHMV